MFFQDEDPDELMLYADDEIEVNHMIRCRCLMIFQSMEEWIDHKNEFIHSKTGHIVTIKIGDYEKVVVLK